MRIFGPTLPISQQIHKDKYRLKGETFDQSMQRIASALSDNSAHNHRLSDILLHQRFLPAGRIQTGAGTDKATTLFNCFVSGDIDDSFVGPGGIMDRAKEAAQTMRMGGGVGYNFSSLRPRGDLIRSLDSQSSGPVSFMDIYDAVCRTVSSSGHRRGAQMGILSVDHPDIEEFVRAKRNSHKLTGFNISVGITDEFMSAVRSDSQFDLRFGGRVYKSIRAKALWDEIMQSTWDYAEPGVLFLDRINQMNNLWYAENINATNPCSEQPLPAFGACLLGSFNLVRYVEPSMEDLGRNVFNYALFARDIFDVVRAMDNAIDVSQYPLVEQKDEAHSKRRMGLGITGFANASEILGWQYASQNSLKFLEAVCAYLRDFTYRASIELARERGAFPLFDKDKYLEGKFIQTLPDYIKENLYEVGIRNSHLTSIAPTGTISIVADNVSSGIEPPFNLEYTRTIQTFDGPTKEVVTDYAYNKYKIMGKTADKCSVDEHLAVLTTSQRYIDSAVSKTVNVGANVTFDEFENIYMKAYQAGAKGLSTFRINGLRAGVLESTPAAAAAEVVEMPTEEEPLFCTRDPLTGERSCG